MSDLFPLSILQVALPIPLPRSFDYLPPAGQTVDAGWIGCRVKVPFGNAIKIGIVIAVAPLQDTQRELRAVTQRLDQNPLFTGELLASLRWCARYYQAPIGETLATALPTNLRAGADLPDTGQRGWALTLAGAAVLPALRAGSSRELLTWLQQSGPIEQSLIEDRFANAAALRRRLHSSGRIEPVMLKTATLATGKPGPAPNPEQQAAVAAICAGFGRHQDTDTHPLQFADTQPGQLADTHSTSTHRHSGTSRNPDQQNLDTHLSPAPGFQPFLLDGITGSGKTEVYLSAIERCLDAGRQALVLVPEIGLTPQMLSRFRQRLGVPVLAFHSGLSDGERARAWTAMARAEGSVLIGTRSAVFVPLPAAGLIIVDEEHDSSYKQLDGIRYHARDVAIVRAQALAVPIVLGSATASLESLHNARQGRYMPLRLTKRAGQARSPQVQVIDIRKRHLIDGLSEPAFEAIGQCLARGEQALVFRNRRGYAPVLLCHDCGWSAQCKDCDAPLTVHAGAQRLICHHCGARQPRPLACPDCGSLGLQPQGAGTQRLEQALAAHFPSATLLRVDRDNTRRKDALEQQLAKLGDASGILVGTQMLAKGHDLPNLTLVVVVGVDEGLYSADFRATERLAQLLIQVSGRAGRASKAGQVLLQTHHPQHPVLTALLHGGYRQLADQLLDERAAASLPPYAHLALLRAQAKQQTHCEQFLADAKACWPKNNPAIKLSREQIILSAILPAPMPRRAGYQRAQILIQSPHRPLLQAMLSDWIPQLYELPSARRVQWSIDIDPVDLY